MQAIKAKLSPETKRAIGGQFQVATAKAYARGDDAGWRRGFRIGVLLAFAVCSGVGLVAAGAALVFS